jgi:hypothetical protein
MIIGFAGKAASGKTTAARHLLNNKDIDIVVLPMASLLRDEVAAFLCDSGAEEMVPLVYGDQDDKVRVFHLDEEKALQACPAWARFVVFNAEIQDQPGKTAVSVRRILQWWGTEYRRAQDPDYWTRAWERKLGELDLEQTHVLVDDVRFINELKMIRKHGGFFIRVERPGFNGANDHSSENSLDAFNDWDLVVSNDSSLEVFLARIDNILLSKLDLNVRCG